MNSIDPSKISTEITRSEADINKDISKESSKLSSAMAEKQRLAIGLLLKQTLDNLSQSGLLSIDTQKAVLSAKQILPGEFTQIYIQDRVVQHKLAEATIKSTTITPKELTLGTIQQWSPGQLIQSIVYQQTQNGLASLLVNGAGQFDANILSQVLPQIAAATATQSPNQTMFSEAQIQLQIKSALELLAKVPLETVQKILRQMLSDNIISSKAASEILTQLTAQKQDIQNPASQNPAFQNTFQNKSTLTKDTIAANTLINITTLQQAPTASKQLLTSEPQVQQQIKSALELLAKVPLETVQKILRQMLSDNIISSKAASEILTQLTAQKQDIQNPTFQNPAFENQSTQTKDTIAANTLINNTTLQQASTASKQLLTSEPQVQQQIKSALELLSNLPLEIVQKTLKQMLSNRIISPQAAAEILTQLDSQKQGIQKQRVQKQEVQPQGYQKRTVQAENTVLANNPINNKIIKQAQVVQVKTDLLLQPGQQLLIQVNKNAADISFQIHHSPKESHQVSQYINQYVTRQQALPQLLASLKEISKQMNQPNSYFTAQFIKQVDKLLQQLPQLAQLTTINDIKNVVQNSGQFLENKLLNSATQALNPDRAQIPAQTQQSIKQISQTDLKANLSNLAAMIHKNEAILLPKNLSSEHSLYQSIEHRTLTDIHSRSGQFFDLPNRIIHAQVQAPAADNLFHLNSPLLLQNRLLEQLEGVLSRLVVTQLHSRESGSEQVLLNFEIPFRNNDQQEVLQLKIREEFKDKEARKGNKIWTVNMAFHLPSLGAVRIYITLDKIDLAIQFWTEEKNSQHLLQQLFPLLKERLFNADFTISQLTAFHGVPEAAKKEQTDSQFIVDERV